MIVTPETLYTEFQPVEDCVDEASKTDLMKAAERAYKACNELTLDEFWGVMNGDYSLLGNLDEPKVLQVYWLKRFAQFVDEFGNECKRTQLEPTPEQRQASQGTLEMLPVESMLVFVRQYFGLHSFADCGRITIGEYLTARKDHYNDALIQRNYEKIQREKLKLKK